jgi:hypothetical protein
MKKRSYFLVEEKTTVIAEPDPMMVTLVERESRTSQINQ